MVTLFKIWRSQLACIFYNPIILLRDYKGEEGMHKVRTWQNSYICKLKNSKDRQIMHSEVQTAAATIISYIYFLSFEHSELEGKYSLIVSVYVCMHA